MSADVDSCAVVCSKTGKNSVLGQWEREQERELERVPLAPTTPRPRARDRAPCNATQRLSQDLSLPSRPHPSLWTARARPPHQRSRR